MNFPEWSDLGKISTQMRLTWENQVGLWQNYARYFYGYIFKDRVPSDSPVEREEDLPLLYPAGMNLVRMLCLAQTDAAFGDWEDQIVRFEVRQDDQVDDAAKEAIALASQILNNSRANTLLWEVELDRNVFGGCPIKILPDMAMPGHIRWSRIPLEGFFPVWNPDNPDELLEVYVVVEMTCEQAKATYNFDSTGQIVRRVEHWTHTGYENYLDNKRIDAFSGINPWGIVPFVYVPRFRSNSWWGDSLTEEIIPVQDDLNMKLGDIGDAINYNAHPVRWGVNLPASFNARNFPIGINSMWDLGRSFAGFKPEVGLLEAKNPIPSGTYDYLNFLFNWSRTSVFMPPIALGDDNGGGQRSGATLEIRMLPMIRAVKRSRSYLGAALSQALVISGKILQQKRFPDVSTRAVQRFLNGSLIPRFETILPQDHQAIVDEVVKLLSSEPKSISIETAQKILGRGTGEVERIKAMLKDKEIMPAEPEPTNDLREGMRGKQQPQTEKKPEERK